MRSFALAAAVAALAVTPAAAALKEGAKAPDFTAQGFQAGKPISFSLAKARQSGPVVLYFFPAAETAGCNLEARLFAESIDQFKAQGATVIGVTSGNLDKLASFSADTEKCSGKFPVAADPSAKIAAQYDATLAVKPGWSSRTSYVISPAGQIIHAYSDMKANDHVTETLGAVKAWRAQHPKK
jgi:Peroxiredoxin